MERKTSAGLKEQADGAVMYRQKNDWKDEDAWSMLISRSLHERQRYEGEPVE